jgi:NhaP-type Na+/H+ or K+/H+ antiporter
MLGLVAFLTCVVRGVLHAWPPQQALLVAWTSLLAFALLGSVIGWIAEWILEDEVRGRIAAGSDAAKPAPPTQTFP